MRVRLQFSAGGPRELRGDDGDVIVGLANRTGVDLEPLIQAAVSR